MARLVSWALFHVTRNHCCNINWNKKKHTLHLRSGMFLVGFWVWIVLLELITQNFSSNFSLAARIWKSVPSQWKGWRALHACSISREISANWKVCLSCSTDCFLPFVSVTGVQSIVVALIAGKAEINYNPSLTSVEKLIAEMTALGYRASLIDSPFSAFSKIHLTVCSSFMIDYVLWLRRVS